jgi:hypothetical protein
MPKTSFVNFVIVVNPYVGNFVKAHVSAPSKSNHSHYSIGVLQPLHDTLPDTVRMNWLEPGRDVS